MKKTLSLVLLVMLGLALVGGCYTTGKVAGDAVQGVEQGAKDLKKGYEDGKKD